MPELVIISGLPGSGKSTLAKAMTGHTHYEADMWFVDEQTGEYVFDRTQVGHAHNWCKSSVRCALEEGKDVVVSNTFTQQWEVNPYLAMATELGATVRHIEATGSYGSIHGVPEEVIKAMANRKEVLRISWRGQ